MRLFKIVAAVTLLALGPVSAHAAIATFWIKGITIAADEGNPFGLEAGDLITAEAHFDTSALDGDLTGTISFGAGSGNSLDFHVGALAFDETNDIDFFGGFFPILELFEGGFDGFDYVAVEGINGADADFGAGFGWFGGGFGWDGSFLAAEGDWGMGYLAVPEPGSLALLGMGLAGLGFARRRKSA